MPLPTNRTLLNAVKPNEMTDQRTNLRRPNGLKPQVTEQKVAGQPTSACDPTMQVCL